MKVKLKKHKKSPAPRSTEQAKIKSTIEKLRKTRTYGVPIHVVYDRGYQQVADLASRIQKNKEKTPAPIASKQTKPEIAVDLGRRPHYWLDECAKQVIKEAKENIEKKKAEIKTKKELQTLHLELITNDIARKAHRAIRNSETPDAFMTSEQKKQMADALVSYVLRVTDDSHYMDQEEVTILPTILDFLAKTDSSKTIRSDNL